MNQTINTDEQEIAKFTHLASDWWNPHGKLKTLHDINPLRLGYVLNHSSLVGKRVLDVGCGGGIFAESLAREGAIVTGIDMSDEALNVAREHSQQNNLTIDYLQITVEEFAQTHAGEFDVITCMELLEHVPDPVSIVNACAQLVKENGHLFFSTINRNPKAYLFAILGAEYLLQLLPKGTHEYAKFIKPSELSAWARNADLNVAELKGLSYNPLSREYFLSDDVSVNYLAWCKKNGKNSS